MMDKSQNPNIISMHEMGKFSEKQYRRTASFNKLDF